MKVYLLYHDDAAILMGVFASREAVAKQFPDIAWQETPMDTPRGKMYIGLTPDEEKFTLDEVAVVGG